MRIGRRDGEADRLTQNDVSVARQLRNKGGTSRDRGREMRERQWAKPFEQLDRAAEIGRASCRERV